jgi:Trm5-related predicted tRNA methylase
MFKEERQYSEVFDKSKIVYLSPDATDVLQTVDEDAVYIIGGIVDDNKLTVRLVILSRHRALFTH